MAAQGLHERLSNPDKSGHEPIQLDLISYDASGKESKQGLALGPRATSRYSVRQLVLAAGLTGSYGGIKVYAATHAGSLDTVHVLFDEEASFSAILRMFDRKPNATIKKLSEPCMPLAIRTADTDVTGTPSSDTR